MNSGPQIVERMDWEGVVGGPTALAILAALAMWTAWSLWRERFAVGRGWAAAFWVLRMVAFGCALWMLAGTDAAADRADDAAAIDRDLRRRQREHGRRRRARPGRFGAVGDGGERGRN